MRNNSSCQPLDKKYQHLHPYYLKDREATWQAYYILDELLIAGELQESSKKTVARLIAAQDSLVETAKEEASSISNIIAQATK
ncbi:AP-1 complex subunit sigma-1 [Vitis vinifera]|uniref:AP-1 complex subunit sigma-1 n=1 Tax=Vitis vinifera TaxID=29760 RepID=A0A438IYZ8_VITVI|nr:AP-1 complex subunit sigma-1 [Vitis vinifera]RVX01922.1 AP-1 complex subunit sigma-1 [Vitis vinifera]